MGWGCHRLTINVIDGGGSSRQFRLPILTYSTGQFVDGVYSYFSHPLVLHENLVHPRSDIISYYFRQWHHPTRTRRCSTLVRTRCCTWVWAGCQWIRRRRTCHQLSIKPPLFMAKVSYFQYGFETVFIRLIKTGFSSFMKFGIGANKTGKNLNFFFI